MLGVIGGGSFKVFGELKEEIYPDTPYGKPSSPLRLVETSGKAFWVLLRHGDPGQIPPHRINHRANIKALSSVGVEGIIGVNSVGSLRKEIPPGSLVVPEDYFCPWTIQTFFEDRAIHITPGLDPGLRKALVEAAKKVGLEVFDYGVYVQTNGPRLETKAEIKFFSTIGHVIGMTMVHEATLCCELRIPYASLCTVDNYAHGLVDEPLSQEQIVLKAKENSDKVIRVLENLRL